MNTDKINHFSVLMSIFYKEKPAYFNRCMHSIWEEQSLKPNEVILVQDGPLFDELCNAIATWQERLKGKLKVISIKENEGLGNALKIGIENSSYDIIARMDTDDIADFYRFEKQIDFLEKYPDIYIVGSWISEFERDEDKIISYRRLPEKYDNIVLFGKQISGKSKF